ncbi:hypothetical protein HDU76_013532 [Blyttiomyces sp. JEL0837]|nr:hypothetical protein HDU76_013532 [Blyttiomyces sp. JEL0837]
MPSTSTANKRIKIDNTVDPTIESSDVPTQHDTHDLIHKPPSGSKPVLTTTTESTDTPMEDTFLEEKDHAIRAKKVAAALTLEHLTRTRGRDYLIESDVGINAFLEPGLPSLTGIIKHRFSDFLVNEVDLHGRILHLEKPPAVEEKPEIVITDEIYEELGTLLDDFAIVARIRELYANPTSEESNHVTSKPIEDKTQRTRIHNIMKRYFAGVLTTQGYNDKTILIRPMTEAEKNTKRVPKVNWGDVGGEYLEFVMYKENRDTMEVINHLAKVTRTPAKAYTFAGTKDKRGITVQRLTGDRIVKEILENVHDSVNQVRLSGFRYVADRAKLGDLLGNHFVITLRDVKKTDPECKIDIDEIVKQSVESLRDQGFINFYGMQRFGTRSISTHAVGVAMLAERFDIAVDLIMAQKGDERDDFKKARQNWIEKKNPDEALKLFPRSCVAERAVLTSFSKQRNTTGCLQALQAIPRNLRLMYVHAVQSYVWNQMASERIKLYGRKIVKGDLVAKHNPMASVLPTVGGDDNEEADRVAYVEEARQGKMIEVQVVETDEEAEGLSLEDLVLPLPGHSVEYPRNRIGELYAEFMAGFGLDPFNMKRKQREISLGGDYRRVISKPKNVSWKTLRYNDPNVKLTLSDLDKINGEPEPESIPDGSQIAVVCEFTLDTSSYATMALREVLKVDTSAGYQSVLSADHKTKPESDEV